MDDQMLTTDTCTQTDERNGIRTRYVWVDVEESDKAD